jgi:hypothetical protein
VLVGSLLVGGFFVSKKNRPKDGDDRDDGDGAGA